MGQVLHGGATTTTAVRRAIQHSQESLRTLSQRYGINPKTVSKWRKRTSVSDLPTGPKEPHSSVLSIEEEAIIVAFRRHTLLPLDDCLYALQPTIPHLSRSTLHRCLKRHGISKLPEIEGDKPKRKKFKTYPIGFFHIDITEVRTAEGKLYLYVAIDRTSKFVVARLVERANTVTASAFLDDLVANVPYQIHTVLTDNVLCGEGNEGTGQEVSNREIAPAGDKIQYANQVASTEKRLVLCHSKHRVPMILALTVLNTRY